MRLLEEFWYGNIEPIEYDTNACKEYKELLHLITRNEEKLQATIHTSAVIINDRVAVLSYLRGNKV